jgi:hypothetical protein
MGASTFVRREEVRGEGVFAGRARFTVSAGGPRRSIAIVDASSDPGRMQALADPARRVCAALPAEVERHGPSPVGTPTPGEDRDPVRLERTSREGRSRGLGVQVFRPGSRAGTVARVDLPVTRVEPRGAPGPGGQERPPSPLLTLARRGRTCPTG